MADDPAGEGSDAGWTWVRPVLSVVMVVAGALWAWAVIRWVARGQAGYGIPALLMVAACGTWLATFGRGRAIPPSSWDAGLTVVRVNRARQARSAALGAALPVIFLLNALTSDRGDPTVAGLVYASLFGLVIVGGVLGLWRMLDTVLTISADEVVLTMPRGLIPGIHVRSRRRDAVDGYRRRPGSVELLPWPPPGGARGPDARRQRITIPTMTLPASDIERALRLHEIGPA